jgi:Bacterial Ig-like domain (group 3)/Bacterial Ig domain
MAFAPHRVSRALARAARTLGAVIALAGSFAFPASATDWPNEPAGATLLTDFGFATLKGDGWGNSASPYVTIVSDSEAPLSPPAVAQYTYPAGMTGGVAPGSIGWEHPELLGGVRDLFLGFWWKPSSPWQGHASGVNKLVFISQYGGACGGSLQNIVFTMFGINASGTPNPPGPYKLRATTEFLGTARNYSPNVSNPDIVLGEWHRIEILIRPSTTATSGDGVLRWWLDGTLLGDYTTVNYPQCPWDVVAFSPTWGGVGDTKTETDHFWYDHAHLSNPTASSSSTAPPPTTPPPADTQPPSVTITAPAASATVSGLAQVAVAASDNVGVTTLKYYLDGALIAVVSPPSGTFAWDTTAAPDGPHSMGVTALDAAGNAASAAVAVTVLNHFTTTLTITAPPIASGSDALVTVSVAAAGAVPTGSVALAVDGAAPMAALLVNGKAVFSLLAPSAGNHALVASFAAQGSFAASSATGTLSVGSIATAMTVSAPPITQGGKGSVNVTVSAASGTPTGSVALVVDNGAPLTAPLVNGQAQFTLRNLSVGDHSLALTYTPQGVYAGCSGSGTLHVNPKGRGAGATANH